MKATAAFLCLLLFSCRAVLAQQAPRALTNADIVKMVKSGIGDQTIVLTIRKAEASNFDTSPNALIELKKDGVSDTVLDAMLNVVPADQNRLQKSPQDCAPLLNRVLAVFGDTGHLAAVRSIHWDAKETVSSGPSTTIYKMDHVIIYPSDTYTSIVLPNGATSTEVYTPEFNYLKSGKETVGLPATTAEGIQYGLKLDPVYIAQHRDQYTCVSDGTTQIGNVTTTILKVASASEEARWNVDPSTDRLLRTSMSVPGGQTLVSNFSDWREVAGISVPFARHEVQGNTSMDIAINSYAVNPAVDPSLFSPPAKQIVATVTFKVLQSESVPYVVQTNGGVSTACNISGSTDTTMSASTYGNTTYGTATSTPNLQMNCNSSQNTYRWTHVLNAMFVHASDGNAYIIACDRAWRWSKCTPLKVGDTFLAKLTDKGFVVQYVDRKSKQHEATYSILQSRSLRN